MKSPMRYLLLPLLTIGWLSGAVTACSDSPQTGVLIDSRDTETRDTDVGRDGEEDIADVTTAPDAADADTPEPNRCDRDAIYGTVPGFYAGHVAFSPWVPADQFVSEAVVVVADPTHFEVELTTEPRARLKVDLPAVGDFQPDWPGVGQSVEVTSACSPFGTWCENDSYVSIRMTQGERVFEGGQIFDIEFMPDEIKSMFAIRYNDTPSGDSCSESKELDNGVLCEWGATPVHLELLGTDTRVPSGGSRVVDLDGRRYLLNALKVQHVEDTCPPTDTILDASYAYLVAIKP